MSTVAMKAAWQQVADLSSLLVAVDQKRRPNADAAGKVLLRLAWKHEQSTGVVAQTHQQLADDLGLSATAVKTALNAFEELGLTRIVKRGAKGSPTQRELAFLPADEAPTDASQLSGSSTHPVHESTRWVDPANSVGNPANSVGSVPTTPRSTQEIPPTPRPTVEAIAGAAGRIQAEREIAAGRRQSLSSLTRKATAELLEHHRRRIEQLTRRHTPAPLDALARYALGDQHALAAWPNIDPTAHGADCPGGCTGNPWVACTGRPDEEPAMLIPAGSNHARAVAS